MVTVNAPFLHHTEVAHFAIIFALVLEEWHAAALMELISKLFFPEGRTENLPLFLIVEIVERYLIPNAIVESSLGDA